MVVAVQHCFRVTWPTDSASRLFAFTNADDAAEWHAAVTEAIQRLPVEASDSAERSLRGVAAQASSSGTDTDSSWSHLSAASSVPPAFHGGAQAVAGVAAAADAQRAPRSSGSAGGRHHAASTVSSRASEEVCA